MRSNKPFVSIDPITQAEARKYDEELLKINPNILSIIEVAGFCAYECVLHAFYMMGLKISARIGIVVGPGNNGSDGLVVAKYLKNVGYDVYIHYKIVKHQTLLNTCINCKIPVIVDSFDLSEYDLIIDAIFGFNFKGELSEPWAGVVEQFKNNVVISIDVPSGYPVDGCGLDLFIPKYVICFFAPKICCVGIETYIVKLYGPPYNNVTNFKGFIRLRNGYEYVYQMQYN